MEKAEPRDLTELLLYRVRQRPAMYLGNPLCGNWVETLETFLDGYRECYRLTTPKREERYLTEFLDWLLTRTGAPNPSRRMGPILDECNGDNERAYKRFFEYLEEFDREIPYKAPV